jgi:RNA polymerase sigma factor (sigma-70 family)
VTEEVTQPEGRTGLEEPGDITPGEPGMGDASPNGTGSVVTSPKAQPRSPYEDLCKNALLVLYRYAPGVRKQLNLQKADIEEAIQETLLCFYQQLGKGVIKNPHSWLWAVLVHRAIDRIKKLIRERGRLQQLGKSGDLDAVVDAGADNLLQQEREQILRKAIDQLSPILRQVVLLYYTEDLSCEQISMALAIPLGTVQSRLHLAREKLREHPALREVGLGP